MRSCIPASAYEMQDRLANSTTLTMDGVGHLPYEEVPAEFNRIVGEFLLRHHPATGLEMGESDDVVAHASLSAGRDDRRQSHLAG